MCICMAYSNTQPNILPWNYTTNRLIKSDNYSVDIDIQIHKKKPKSTSFSIFTLFTHGFYIMYSSSSRHLHWMNIVILHDSFIGWSLSTFGFGVLPSLGLRSTNRHKSFDLSLWLVISRHDINLREGLEHWVYTSYEGISGTVLKDNSLGWPPLASFPPFTSKS